MEEVPIYHKIIITVEEASKLTNLGINKVYDITKERDCDFVLRQGKRILIKREPFVKYLMKKSVV